MIFLKEKKSVNSMNKYFPGPELDGGGKVFELAKKNSHDNISSDSWHKRNN